VNWRTLPNYHAPEALSGWRAFLPKMTAPALCGESWGRRILRPLDRAVHRAAMSMAAEAVLATRREMARE